MQKINNQNHNEHHSIEEKGSPFSSNHVRLSPFEWLIAVFIVSLFVYFLPAIWVKAEHFDIAADYRLPYQLSDDYWLYNRFCKAVCRDNATLVIGDSVIWGQYVEKGQTLSHYLNEFSAGQRFINMGIDGLHPVAAFGLIKYYGKDITGKNIILHFNPLWLSSSKYDLQTKKEFAFNHPELVPQFIPKIPCYYASISARLPAVLQRHIGFFGWVKHLQLLYLQDDGAKSSFAEWFIAHPYENPFKDITSKLNMLAESRSPKASPQNIDAIKYDLPWVEVNSSLQWKYFAKAIKLLQERKNNVFVLIGPFNEHKLNEKSLASYSKVKNDIESWLIDDKINYFIPPPLPEQLFADASHPTADGYALLAEEIIKRIEK
jgi:hypothetical protein